MSLYHKYRPKDFSEVKGNQLVVEAVQNMLKDIETAPHAFLLYGPTGCGKTTIGRLIVERVGCMGNDFTEVDSGQFRGIDTIREVRKNAMYAPLEGKSKVWLIDECHKLSGDAQEALLKILEDTPDHVYFILCTTDHLKLKEALRNRCAQFAVKVLKDTEMFTLLRLIAKREGHSLDKQILDQIVVDSLGHPRMAIQILEQVLKTDPEKRMEIARQTVIEQSQAIELARALISGKKWDDVSRILAGLKDQEPESIRRMIVSYCSTILLKKDDNIAGLILENMISPFYDTGFPQLVLACLTILRLSQEE